MIYYTDGSTYPRNPANGGAGFVVVGTTKDYLAGWYLGETITNNQAETMAVLGAIEFAIKYHDKAPVIRSDSAYVGYGLGRILMKKTLLGTNMDLWEEMRTLIIRNMLNVTIQHVPGHSNVLENEVADSLAGLGAKKTATGQFIEKGELDAFAKTLKKANKGRVGTA